MNRLDAQQPDVQRMLQELEWLVTRESPSACREETNQLVSEVDAYLREWLLPEAGRVRRIPGKQYGDALLLEWGQPKPLITSEVIGRPSFLTDDDGGLHILILAHLDTVHPLGSLTASPFCVKGGVAYGPGVLDDKAGVVIVLAAIRQLQERWNGRGSVRLLLTADEEVGSPESRMHIETLAKASSLALIMEPAATGGALKTSRFGTGRYHLSVFGRAAHAGNEPEKGISAVREMANWIVFLYQLVQPQRGTYINVGLIQGGTASNVIAAKAECWVDVRAKEPEEAVRVKEAVSNWRPQHPEASVQVEGGINRPPWNRTQKSQELYRCAVSVGAMLGWQVTQAHVGGGSDGNFTAQWIPTLDGLGGEGSGMHTLEESVLISSLEKKGRFLGELMARLMDGSSIS